ncbi:MAG: DNA repair protein RecO [Dokdonella sp.]
MNRVADQPAFVLHSRPYRETSLLVDALTRDHGQIGLVARGVRKEKSRWRGVLQPLQSLQIGWYGNGELVTLTAAEPGPAIPKLIGERLFAGIYLNELVLRLGRRGDDQAKTFHDYEQCLQRLGAGESTGWTLRRFERDFLQNLGYALPLTHSADDESDIDPDGEYDYELEAGPRAPLSRSSGLRLRGSSLLALAADVAPDEAGLRHLRQLMRLVIRHHLGGGVLNAWQLRLR